MRTRPKKGEPGYAEYRAHENARNAANRSRWASHSLRYRLAYRAEHRDEMRAYRERWNAAHPGYKTAKAREWRAANPERAREIGRRSYRNRQARLYLAALASLILDYRARCAAAEA